MYYVKGSGILATVILAPRGNAAWCRVLSKILSKHAGIEARVDGHHLIFQLPLPADECWELRIDGGSAEDAGAMAIHGGQRHADGMLVARSADGGGWRLLDRVRIKVVGHLPHKTGARLREAAAFMPARTARHIMAGIRVPTASFGYGGDIPESRAISSWQRRLQPLALARNLVHRAMQERFEEVWTIGVVQATPGQVMRDGLGAGVRWFEPRDRGYLADPFAVEIDGHLRVFAEAYDFEGGRKGYLVTGDAEDLAGGGRGETVLREDHHLSWPQVFEHEGAWWMLPEACGGGEVRLYRADPFPHCWTAAAVLLPGFAGADPTLYRDDTGWWMFVTDHMNQDETVLHLYFADRLEGPWHPHPENPVKADLSSARPAGPLFLDGDDLVRPAQDCSHTYGGAVTLNRVIAMTREHYREEVIARVEPDAGSAWPDGVHTFAGVGSLTIVDAKREFFSWKRWWHGLRQLVRGS